MFASVQSSTSVSDQNYLGPSLMGLWLMSTLGIHQSCVHIFLGCFRISQLVIVFKGTICAIIEQNKCLCILPSAQLFKGTNSLGHRSTPNIFHLSYVSSIVSLSYYQWWFLWLCLVWTNYYSPCYFTLTRS